MLKFSTSFVYVGVTRGGKIFGVSKFLNFLL